MKLEFYWQIFKTYSIIRLNEICPVGAELFHVERQTDMMSYILITNLMHWLLFIHKILFSSTCAHLQEDTVVYMQHMVLSLSMTVPGGLPVHSLRTDCRGKVVGGVLRHLPTTFPLQSLLTQAVYRQATRNCHREWQYHTLHVYNCILLKMSTWGSKHVEECTKVGN